MRTIPSPPAVTIRLPSEENDTVVIPNLCSFKTAMDRPLAVSQSRTVEFESPAIMRLSSGENDADRITPLDSSRVARDLPVAASHIRAISEFEVRMRLPLCENITAL